MAEEITIPVALMHTGVSMGTVFLVLILISFVIYLLRFVPKLFEKKEKPVQPAKKTAQTQKPQAKTAPANASKKTTDNELVAVIAAAVAATMTEEKGVPVSPEGLVIRSIRKRNF